MSEGMRSGVHWMRWKSAPIERAKARAAIVLPVPGTSSEQHVPAREQRDQQQLEWLLRADDDLRDVLADRLRRVGEGAHRLRPRRGRAISDCCVSDHGPPRRG